MKIDKKLVYLGVVLIGLILTFFVGRSFDASTGKRSLILTANGISHFRKGLDVSGGTRLIYKIAYDKYEAVYTNPAELAAVKKMIEDIILKNIDARISKLGVSDYKAYVQKLDESNYIVVEIGGVADLDQAKNIIGKTLELEFMLKNPKVVSYAERKQVAKNLYAELNRNPDIMDKILEGKGSANIYYNYFSGASLDQLSDVYKNNIKKLENAPLGKLNGEIIEGKYHTLIGQDQMGNQTGVDLNGFTFFRVLDKQEVMTASGNVMVYAIEDVFVQDKQEWIQAIDDQGNALNGAYFKFANTSSSQVGEPVVAINFDDQGKDIFCRITEKNIGSPMAIFIGGQLLTAPNIQSKICGGTAQIDGSFTNESAKELASSLNDGAMPAPLILMQEEKISPSLGENALTGALVAAGIGFIAILILIFFMYGIRKTALTAIVLLSFMIVLAGFMKLTDYALSLSGIAAIILALGMGVDANILIYERLREELKTGKSMESAINEAKGRSWTAIRDGQLSTGLIALILFFAGMNIFKGFGAMMLTTMTLTLLFNVPVTKTLLHIFYKNTSK